MGDGYSRGPLPWMGNANKFAPSKLALGEERWCPMGCGRKEHGRHVCDDRECLTGDCKAWVAKYSKNDG